MIKPLAIIGILIILTSSQTTVTPKTQMCSCSNLLNQQDCSAQQGCTWTFISSDSQNQNFTITSGQCNNTPNSTVTNQSQLTINQCSGITNQTSCAQSLGCAFFNNSCILFSGCSAYVQTTNSQCQAISILCTSDGLRCSDPQPCKQYTTQSLCLDNIATSGAKSCKWIQQGQLGQCQDKVCSDAPTKYNTNSLCNGWIEGCLTTGQGCTDNLGTCSSYPQAAGCTGMIGSDGPCTSNSDKSSLTCRPLTCTDAPNTLKTDSDCSKFLSGCLTNGQGCVKTLQSCNTYQQSQTCSSLIGSEGPCTVNSTNNSTQCRALSCTDAPSSLNSNEGCNQFLKNCLTTGLGCIQTLGLCSSYTGTDTQCNLYIGSDGYCRGSGSTNSQCQVRKCDDAPKTTNTDSGCNQYQKGCITNGAGCVVTLQLCQQYTGTATTCLQYKSSDGNCMAPTSQTSDGPCVVKVCSNATQNTNTNTGCQQYSYNCVTNGTSCIQQPSCEITQFEITCQGNPSCSSGQICLDRSSCTNYYNQSLCLLNQQQYKVGQKIYLRNCLWNNTCQNITCSSLPSNLTTDQDCSSALAGCITRGNGCVEINDSCNSYQGLISTCQKYKGLNGTQACTQLASETNASAPCIPLTQCSQAKLYSQVVQTSNQTCDTFLKGCYFDGIDSCTNGDCTSYYGTLTTCQNIQTATYLNKQQKCWKVSQTTSATSACIPRTCSHATISSSEPFNSDTLCDNFMKGCVWNGKASGGCQDASTLCTNYTGSANQCGLFAQSGQKCTKTTGFCKFSVTPSKTCASAVVPTPITSATQGQLFCQSVVNQYGNNCVFNPTKCVDSIALAQNNSDSGCKQFVPDGSTTNEKNAYCGKMKYSKQDVCVYKTGDRCQQQDCELYLAIGTTTEDKTKYCQDIKITFDQACTLNQSTGYCQKQKSCGEYEIPASTTALIDKIKFCSTNNCHYSDTQGNFCIKYQDCGEVGFITSDYDNRRMICQEQKVNGQVCQLNSSGSSCMPQSCSEQKIDWEKYNTNLIRQFFCLQYQTCAYHSSIGNCRNIDPFYCDQYQTFGADAAENIKLCKNYGCLYTSGETCSKVECSSQTTDMSFSKCQEYFPTCLFDGQQCIDQRSKCTDYPAQQNGLGSFTNCSNLKTLSNESCGYAPDVKCKSRDCSDIASGSDSICSSYKSDCIFNGTGCIKKGSCDSYPAFGSTQQEKATFCQTRAPAGDGKCTFAAGQTNCIAAVNSCDLYQISSFSGSTPEIGCSLLIDSNGQVCYYNSGSKCSTGDCSGAPSTVNSDADCKAYKPFCVLDTITPCSVKSCSNAPIDLTTDSACSSYRLGCITNGKGCIESNSSCSDFKGTAQICANFIAKNGQQLCGNAASSIATDSCQNRICTQNTTAKTDQECDKWILPTGNAKNCVWNGTSGCIPPQNCAQFQGTIETCPKFTALDGPCSGSGNAISPCSSYDCLNAPKSYNTDILCKSWGPNCMTNGFGCIPIGQCTSIASHQACSLYQNTLGCDLAKSCKTKPQQCSDFLTATECNNNPITGLTLPGCGWNAKTNKCGVLSCENLPLTLTTHQQCSQSISICTTTGSGCIVKGSCSTYSKLVCGIAETTDIQKVCIWSNQNSVCRPIQCTDNTTATSDSACENYLTGCKSTGSGCGTNLKCQQYTIQQLCSKDSYGIPCVWIQTSNKQGSCINYTKCSDVTSSSHKDCQTLSPHCTTNGTNCIAITSCAKTTSQVSCIIGTDGNCGWLPASGNSNASCALFTSCTAAIGKTTTECQSWSNTCISDGVSCISKSLCSSYQTQQACSNQGTDGSCIWIASQTSQGAGTCRLMLCSDATTSIDTHQGCFSFTATTQCTTSGIGCIPLTTCSQYKSQAGCVLGTDGDCFWQTPTGNSTDSPLCRLKKCTDNILTKSSECLNSISGTKCVSNGSNCINQASCSTYTTKEACLGGGTDGQCAFTPESTSSNVGKCQLFKNCGDANQDQIACNSRMDSCYFNTTSNNGTTTTQCQPHTCQTKAQASSCQPIPSFDLQTYQICVLTDGKCNSDSPSLFAASNCYQNSVATYTWNPTTQKCSQCKQGTSSVNNTNNQTNEGQNNLFSKFVGFYFIIALVNF